MKKLEKLQELVLEHLDFTDVTSDSELQEIIYEVLRNYGREEYLSIEERIQVGKDLFNSLRKLDLIQELIEDRNITEIMVNGIQNIFIEKKGKLLQLERRFVDARKLEDIAQQIVAKSNRIVNESSPIVDARLEDGSRVHIVLPPVSLDGPIITIRKFPEKSMEMKDLIRRKSIGGEMAEFLERLVVSRYNILISGGTGSGKTTFLNALSGFIPKGERIITIEDNAELQLQEIPNLVRLEARNANVEGEGEVTIQDLIRASLRMRPNRIIIGEVRGSEVRDMLVAMNTGHDGSLGTAHANSSKDMLQRLESMMLLGAPIPVSAIRRQIASAIDIIVQVGRLRDGSRKVLEISEVLEVEGDEIQLSPIYRFQEGGVKDEQIQGDWIQMNALVQEEKLLAAGYSWN